MDGLAFLTIKSETEKFKDIITLVMSGDEDAEALTANRAREVLRKPLNISSVLAALDQQPYLNLSPLSGITYV